MKKLGFGAMRLPTINRSESEIDIDKFKEMVDYFISRGFNYFDTAYGYHGGNSELAIKAALTSRYNRESFMLANKMPVWLVKKEGDFDRLFNEQLEKCGVEYFDIYLLHALSQDTYLKTAAAGGFEFMEKIKAEQRIKHIGISFHDKADVLEKILIDHPQIEFVQLQINYLDWESEVIQSRLCYETAVKYDKKVLVMEPVKGGALAKVPQAAENLFKACNPSLSIVSWAIRYAASLKGVFMVLSGMSNLEQLKENTSYMQNFAQMECQEKEVVKKAADIINKSIAVPCTACRYCVKECPKNIPIPDYFSLYNDKAQFNSWLPGVYYGHLKKRHGKASECLSCRKCEARCPQKIEISKFMKRVASAFEER